VTVIVLAYTVYIFQLCPQTHTVALINSYLSYHLSDGKLIQVGTFRRSRLTGLAELSVNSIKVMYEQSRELANVKIHTILIIPNFPLRLFAPKIPAFSLPCMSKFKTLTFFRLKYISNDQYLFILGQFHHILQCFPPISFAVFQVIVFQDVCISCLPKRSTSSAHHNLDFTTLIILADCKSLCSSLYNILIPRCNPGIYWENLSQYRRSPGRDLNMGSPEYEAEGITTWP
jgi:hypothetical protein